MRVCDVSVRGFGIGYKVRRWQRCQHEEKGKKKWVEVHERRMQIRFCDVMYKLKMRYNSNSVIL